MKFSENTFKRYMEKQNGRCYYCGCDLKNVSVNIDHIKPFSKYKNGERNNLCLACFRCNSAKSNLEIDEFRIKVKDYFIPILNSDNKFYFETI